MGIIRKNTLGSCGWQGIRAWIEEGARKRHSKGARQGGGWVGRGKKRGAGREQGGVWKEKGKKRKWRRESEKCIGAGRGGAGAEERKDME